MWSKELDSMILLGHFQLGIFSDFNHILFEKHLATDVAFASHKSIYLIQVLLAYLAI